jgi:hypothetical protein
MEQFTCPSDLDEAFDFPFSPIPRSLLIHKTAEFSPPRPLPFPYPLSRYSRLPPVPFRKKNDVLFLSAFDIRIIFRSFLSLLTRRIRQR